MIVQYTAMDLIQKISQNNYTYTNSYKKMVREADTDVEDLQKNVEEFRKYVKGLKSYSSEVTTKSNLEKQLKGLIKSYNSMEKSSESVTDKDVKKQLSKLEELFSENEKDLKKIGIKKTNGDYEFDSEIFEEADDKIIKSLLVGKDSFIRQADKIMRKVEKSADDAEYNNVERKISRNIRYEEEDMEVVTLLTLAKEVVNVMEAYNDKIQEGNVEETDKKNIEQDLEYFAESVYLTDKNDESGNLEKINQLCKENQEYLAKLGLRFDSEYKIMLYDGNSDITSDDFKNAFNELFGKSEVSGEPAFGERISEYCQDAFNSIIAPEKIGVSIIDVQA